MGLVHSRPLKLACLIGQLDAGGTEQQLLLFLKNVDRSLFRPEVWVAGTEGRWTGRARALGVPVKTLGTAGPIRKALRIRELMSLEQVELLWSWSYFTNGYLALAPSTATTLGSLRGALAYCRKSLGMLYPLCEVPVRTMVVNSAESGRELEQAHYRGHVLRIRNMVAPGAGARRLALHCGADLKKDGYLIVGAGRLDLNKNFGMLLEAVACLGRKDVRVAIAGEGPEMEHLRRMSAKLGLNSRVQLLGHVDDVASLLAVADLFVHPSRTEGMPNVVAEAMLARVPIVTTRVGGVEDLLPSSEFGWVIPPNSVHALRLAIGDAIAHPVAAKANAASARTRLLRLFAPGLVTRQIEETLLAVHQGRRGSRSK